MRHHLTRRATLGLLAAAALGGGATAHGARPDVRARITSIGRAYLRERPEEASLAVLDRHLAGRTEDPGAAVARDFAAGRTVLLDGWLLAETECRLCARLALL